MNPFIPNTTFRLTMYILVLSVVCSTFFIFPTFFTDLYKPIRPSHTSIHLLFEIVSIFIAMSIAIHSWITYKEGKMHFPIILAAAFFSVGILDTFHALTFQGMPLFFIESTPMTSTWLWIFARLTESTILAVVVFMPKLFNRLDRNIAFLVSTIYSIVLIGIVFSFYRELPVLIMNGAPTLIKIILEIITALLHLLVIFHLLRNTNKFNDIFVRNFYLIGASSIVLSSVFFIQYKSIDTYLHTAGHLYKIIGYSMFFIVLFIVSVKAPFLNITRLHDRNRMMFNMLELGIIETDARGAIQYVNLSAKELLRIPSSLDETLMMNQFESKATKGQKYEEIQTYTGEGIPVEIDRFPLIENKQIIGYFYTLRDLRESIENERLAKEKLVTDFEIETAAAVQKDFNSEISSGEQIGFVSFPFKRLNGDFYNILKQGSKTMVTIADISGKGIPAAIQTSLMIGAIEHVNLHQEKPDQFVAFINRMFSKYSKSEHFMTLFTMIYDEDTHVLQYCSAGHEPSLVYNKERNEFDFLETKGAAIGFFEDAKYETKTIQLSKDEIVVLYTDGLIEDRRRLEDDLFEDLMNAIRNIDLTLPADTISKHLITEVEKNRLGDIHDDRTIVVLKS